MSIAINQSIFKAYDVRGKYPEEFNEEAAGKIARVATVFLSAKKIVVAMDYRVSSPSLKQVVIDSLINQGIDVMDCGICTTPMFYFSVNTAQADGGIMVTASHNPPEYNGLKITEKRAKPIGEESGLLEIKKIALEGIINNSDTKGKVEDKDYLEAYVDFLIKDHNLPDVKMIIDAGCGPAGRVLNELSRKTGMQITKLCFPPCSVFAHEANPLKDENVKDLEDALRHGSANFGVAFDGDGDRVFFFDSEGARIPTYAVASLIAGEFLRKESGANIISDVRMPMAFDEVVEAGGGNIIKSRVGHAFIKKLLRENNAVFGAEVSGHFYFRDFFNADSGMFAFVKVLDIMAREQKSLTDLTKPFMARFQSGELNYTVADKDAALDKMREIFADGDQSKLDGLTVKYSDWWFNVRPSNTEPLLRVNIEAETESLLEQARDKIEVIL